jgi:Phage tail protein
MAVWDALADCETHEFRNPEGETIRFRTLIGTVGRFMPPVQVTTMPVPRGHGSRYMGTFHVERALALPVAVPGVFDGRAELRRWARVLDPAKGEGTLTVVEGDWAGRQLTCVYEAGLEELEERKADVDGGTLVFRAAYPYWRDAVESSREVGPGETETTWFPFLPLVLGASDAFASFTLNNDGDTPAWPVVTVTGPGQEVTASNLTTGDTWHVTGAIEAGQELVVDARPGFKEVSVDGSNAFHRLTPESTLWPLIPGPNRVEVSMAITDPSSLIRFTWRRNWLSA